MYDVFYIGWDVCFQIYFGVSYSFMEEQIELPKFTEEKRFATHQVLMAKYSHDGKVLATVNGDYSISIWDSHDILVDTYEQSFFHTRGNTRQNSYHAVFLDWSASSKYLYYIVDCSGFLIDIFGPKKICRNFTYKFSGLQPYF